MSSSRAEDWWQMHWTMSKPDNIWTKDVLKIKLLCLKAVPLDQKGMYKSLFHSKQKVMVVRMTRTKKARFLIAHSKCSLKRQFTVLSGQEIFLARCLR